MIRCELTRNQDDDKQTLGEFFINDPIVMVLKTLELPWKLNQAFISRFPPGIYIVKRRWSVRHKWHYIIQDVEGRTWILIHRGNYYKNTKGCVLVGMGIKDIDSDGYMDVIDSKKAMKLMLKVLPKVFELEVRDDIGETPDEIYNGVL